MQITKKELEKSQIELTVELPWEQVEGYITQAVKRISEQVDIPGFRKGTAPIDVIKKKVGDMTVLQEAAALAVDKTLPKAIEEHKLQTVGQPAINFEKLAWENPLIYTATIPVVPSVKVGDVTAIKASKPTVEVTEEEVTQVLENLQKMRAKEVLVERAAANGDKTEVNFNVYLDGIPVEGGKGDKYPLVLGDGQMIPGFEEQVVGMNAGEEKEFKLSFPEEYHNKQLAGKEAEFKVKLESVFERQLPELNAEFAAEMGEYETIDGLKDAIENNLRQEKEQKIESDFEREVIEDLVNRSTFGEIPEIMINQETNQMLSELERNVAAQGLKFDDYLMHMKKDRGQLKLDFAPDAVKRIKSALVIRELAMKESIQPSDDEITEELAQLTQAYGSHPGMAQQLKSAQYREYVKNVLRNRKTLEWLKEQAVK